MDDGDKQHDDGKQHDDEKAALQLFLDAQRQAVLEIIEGLDMPALTTAVLPSGWTPLGLIEHLGYAERHWFQEIATGSAEPIAWSSDDHEPLQTPRSAEIVLDFYRRQIDYSNAKLAATALSEPVTQRHPGLLGEQVTNMRGIVLHMIEETARHAGHLDAVRELIDGKTGLGPR